MCEHPFVASIDKRLADVLQDALDDEERVAAVYVYGSVARGEHTALSDVDVAIVAKTEMGSSERGDLLRRITLKLGRLVPGRTFDVRLLDELPTAVRGRVVSEGTLLAEKDPVARVRAEVATRLAYHDFQHFEREGTREGLAGLRRRLGLG